ncbi:hypothetical protein E2C01_094369 [Portunus trituberculatus]|uniref:Uncharacterized protein n=1 Tax=Portunus trituberculatus TaxID=210409 RepID=A0A5B7K0J8_PORTR|nr:hypothetical protein [Portunus trituberculatus]
MGSFYERAARVIKPACFIVRLPHKYSRESVHDFRQVSQHEKSGIPYDTKQTMHTDGHIEQQQKQQPSGLSSLFSSLSMYPVHKYPVFLLLLSCVRAKTIFITGHKRQQSPTNHFS